MSQKKYEKYQKYDKMFLTTKTNHRKEVFPNEYYSTKIKVQK